MLDAGVVEVPSEVGSELGSVIRSDRLDGNGKPLAQLVDEVDRTPNRVVVVNLQDAAWRGRCAESRTAAPARL